MELNSTYQISTPAKVNFFLNILKRRTDGFHEILTDLVPISLFDRITFAPPRRPGIELISPSLRVKREENLVFKAIRLIEQESGSNFDLCVRLDKTIPVGAGLGGGSGNAAGTLVVLNRLFGLRLSIDELRRLASRLGADVPFFLAPVPSVAEGVGDRLSGLPSFRPLQLLILFPGFPIATRQAYGRCVISGRPERLEDYSPEGFRNHTADRNDFWTSLQRRYRELSRARDALLDRKAIAAGLSGSGSALYAVFSDEDARNRAYEKLMVHPQWRLFPCRTLSNHSY